MHKFSWILPLLSLSGCLGLIPVHTYEHMQVQWRPTYEVALADAHKLGRPLLVVMIAGEKDGPTCLGGDYLRSGALRDPTVIALINDQFVPVWINVREQPVPPFPFTDQVLVTATLDQRRRVIDRFSLTFYLRSVIVSPDGRTLLNPGAPTVAKATAKLVFEGDFTYQSHGPGEYLTMLRHALDRCRFASAHAAAN